MTGWRLGWLVAPVWAMAALERLAQNLFLAASTPAQHAALAAFEPATLAELEFRKAELRARRDFLLPALRGIGFVIPVAPQGAFYLYADCSKLDADSQAFANRLLDVAGVAVTPGIDFGHHHAARHVRFAYTRPLPRLAEAITRIEHFLRP
jgi:aspartate/methionine/tyrosine aminotransferase